MTTGTALTLGPQSSGDEHCPTGQINSGAGA